MDPKNGLFPFFRCRDFEVIRSFILHSSIMAAIAVDKSQHSSYKRSSSSSLVQYGKVYFGHVYKGRPWIVGEKVPTYSQELGLIRWLPKVRSFLRCHTLYNIFSISLYYASDLLLSNTPTGDDVVQWIEEWWLLCKTIAEYREYRHSYYPRENKGYEIYGWCDMIATIMILAEEYDSDLSYKHPSSYMPWLIRHFDTYPLYMYLPPLMDNPMGHRYWPGWRACDVLWTLIK